MKPITIDFILLQKSQLDIGSFVVLQLIVEGRGDDVAEICPLFDYNNLNGYIDSEHHITTKTAELFNDDWSWLEEYRDTFPKVQGSSYRHRSPMPEINKKMRTFIRKYRCKPDEILNATKNYINKQRGDFSYCKTASNFIYKDSVEMSALLSEIEALRETDPITVMQEKTLN